MFKKEQRLSRLEFGSYFRVAKRHHFPHYTILTAPTSAEGGLKVAVVVGKKVSKSAIRRNALRRRVYSILSNFFRDQDIGGVCIVILKPLFSTLPRKTAQQELEKSIAAVYKSA